MDHVFSGSFARGTGSNRGARGSVAGAREQESTLREPGRTRVGRAGTKARLEARGIRWFARNVQTSASRVSLARESSGTEGKKKGREGRERERGAISPLCQEGRNQRGPERGRLVGMASPGKMGLMAMAAFVPCAVLIGVATSGGGANGTTSKAVDGGRSAGRRLQTATATTYDFATQLEMTICLTEDHGTDSATASGEQFKVAVINIFGLEDPDLVKVDEEVTTKCNVDNWQRRISIYNTENESGSAADIASAQVDQIYPQPKTTQFFEELALDITAQDPEISFPAEDLDLESLGFLVIWLDSSGDVVSTQGTTTSKDVVSIGGTDVWWPWWAWLIYAGVVLCCICPMLFFFFKWRRDKEAELDSYGGGSGKDMGAPAPPSATSSNPYGGHYSAEEHKSGK